jgi:enoyl-CoA hydratase
MMSEKVISRLGGRCRALRIYARRRSPVMPFPINPITARGTDLLLSEDRAVAGGLVRILSLHRPERRNALNTALQQDLIAALEDADRDTDVRAVVLAGHGPMFCAGGDLKEFTGLPDARERLMVRARLLTRLLILLPAMSTPVATAVTGAALGAGAALVLASDLIVAGDDLRLGFPEITGSMVPAGVMAGAVRNLGQKLVFQMLTQGRQLDAAEASRNGLLASVVAPENTLVAAVDAAAAWASVDPDAIRETKRLFYRVGDLAYVAGLEAGLDVTAATWRPHR